MAHRHPAGEAEHHREVSGHRQSRRRLLRVRIHPQTGGWAEDVTDEEIAAGIRLLAETEGIYTETAGGVTIAVTKKLIHRAGSIAAASRCSPSPETA